MPETFEVTCPGCKRRLIIQFPPGKIIEVRERLVEESTGDRFEDAVEKVGQDSARVREKFEQSREQMPGRKEALEEKFKDSLKSVDPADRENEPPREIDL